MLKKSDHYLHEMGIKNWELIQPTRLGQYTPSPISLPATCKLLFVSEKKPTDKEIVQFEKILASINLSLKESHYIHPEWLYLLTKHDLTWIWFSGKKEMSQAISSSANQLTSPLLSDIQKNIHHRHELWRQIRSYLPVNENE